MKRIIVFFLCIFLPTSIFGENSDLRFLDGLSERGLFESVEYFYAERIQRVSEHEKIPLATEYVRTLTRWTLQSEPNRRSEILRKREKIEQEFLAPVDDNADPLRTAARIKLRFQIAIGDFALGDEQRLEAVVVAESKQPKALEAARTLLFDAMEKFKACFEAVRELRQRVGSNADADFEQRTSALLRTVRFQWGLAQKSVALSFPNDNENRVFCLTEAAKILSETAELTIDDDAVYRSRVELASCHRLLGNLPHAAQALKTLEGKPLSLEMQFRASTELLRYRLAHGELDAALTEFGGDRNDSVIVPEYDLARLELFLAENQRQTSDEALERIIQLVRNIEHRNGPYWGRRARLVLISSDFSFDNAELLKLLAEEQYRSGRLAESVRLYERASVAAEESGKTEDAFQNAKSAIAVLNAVAQRLAPSEDQTSVQRQLVDGARNLAVRFVAHSEAAELHLNAVDEAAGLVREKNLPLEQYVELLTEHAERWPTSAKSPPLLLRAALILEQQQQSVDALARLERIPNDCRIAPDAVAAAVRCFEQQKDAKDSDAADWFERRISPDGPWSDADVRSALESVGYRLRSVDAADAKTAEGLLRRLLEKRNDLPPTEKAKALSGLVTSLTLQNRKAEASQILDQLIDDNLPPAELRNLLLTKARVLADIGEVQDSVNILTDFLKKAPKDLAFREILAEILSKRNEPEALNKALKLWEDVEEQTQKGSESWWNAKETTLRVLFKLERKNEAADRYKVLRLLYPDLGGTVRKARFEEMFPKNI